jgi:hypothetical protein
MRRFHSLTVRLIHVLTSYGVDDVDVDDDFDVDDVSVDDVAGKHCALR